MAYVRAITDARNANTGSFAIVLPKICDEYITFMRSNIRPTRTMLSVAQVILYEVQIALECPVDG